MVFRHRVSLVLSNLVLSNPVLSSPVLPSPPHLMNLILRRRKFFVMYR